MASFLEEPHPEVPARPASKDADAERLPPKTQPREAPMAPNIPSLPPPSAPFTVPATGLIHEEWYLWLKRINPLLQAAQSALQGLPDDLLHAGTGAELSVGFTQADFDNGAVGAGSFTPDPANGALQRLTVTGAFTLTAAGRHLRHGAARGERRRGRRHRCERVRRAGGGRARHGGGQQILVRHHRDRRRRGALHCRGCGEYLIVLKDIADGTVFEFRTAVRSRRLG